MKRVLVIVALLSTAACGGASSSDRATTTEPQTGTSTSAAAKAPKSGDKTLSESQLKSVLLTVADLPTGYKSVPVKPESTDGPTTSDNAACAKRYAELDKIKDTSAADTEADFEGPGLGTVLQQSLASFKSEDEVKKGIVKLTKVFSDCPTFSSTDSGGKNDFTISPLSFPKLGDQTLAIGVKIKTPTITAVANIVAIRVGRSLQLIVQGGLTTDVAALEKAARAGALRLAEASR